MSKSARVLATIFLAAAPAFAADGTKADGLVDFQPLSPRLNLRIPDPITIAIRSDQDFQALCERSELRFLPMSMDEPRCRQPTAGIDFTKQTLLIVTLGSTNTGAFLARSVFETDNAIVIDATHERFGRGCTVISISVFPVIAILVSATKKRLLVAVTPLVHNCGK